jgi:hypothetical protein
LTKPARTYISTYGSSTRMSGHTSHFVIRHRRSTMIRDAH